MKTSSLRRIEIKIGNTWYVMDKKEMLLKPVDGVGGKLRVTITEVSHVSWLRRELTYHEKVVFEIDKHFYLYKKMGHKQFKQIKRVALEDEI